MDGIRVGLDLDLENNLMEIWCDWLRDDLVWLGEVVDVIDGLG